jgi:hypothetical protein
MESEAAVGESEAAVPWMESEAAVGESEAAVGESEAAVPWMESEAAVGDIAWEDGVRGRRGRVRGRRGRVRGRRALDGVRGRRGRHRVGVSKWKESEAAVGDIAWELVSGSGGVRGRMESEAASRGS